ncbi:response regulator transcription factor [Fictibacillus sp. Mic-4]|uniref:response regulator transcription factor n=1 Tax=Fictibacillus sp. Mic-4 TaxID=3132826 RepID=UPI003CF62B7F
MIYLRILIVDDDALIRDSLRLILDLEEGMDVVGTAADGEEALAFCKNEQPDIVLMDIRMPNMDGVVCTKKIKESWPATKVIILTTFKDDDYIKEALKNGAAGYILKNQSSEAIVETVKTVYKGSMVLHPEVASKLSCMLTDTKPKKNVHVELTSRELDVLKLVAEGLSNKEIAKELYLSEGTVRNYITRMLEKLELRGRTQLAIYYLNYGAEKG